MTEHVCACVTLVIILCSPYQPYWIFKNLNMVVKLLPLNIIFTHSGFSITWPEQIPIYKTLRFIALLPQIFCGSRFSPKENFVLTILITHLSKYRPSFLWLWQTWFSSLLSSDIQRLYHLQLILKWQQSTGFHVQKCTWSLMLWQAERWFDTETGTWVCVPGELYFLTPAYFLDNTLCKKITFSKCLLHGELQVLSLIFLSFIH